MIVYVSERRIALYNSSVSDNKTYVHYLVLMFCFSVDKHATKKGFLLPGDWTLEFAHPDISPQKVDYTSCSLSTFMVANCLCLDLQLDFSKDHGHFDPCREQMALTLFERKDGKQFNPCLCTDKEDKSCIEEEDKQLVHPLESESLQVSHIHLVHWCKTHHIVWAASSMKNGWNHIKMHTCNCWKEGRGDTASQEIDDLDDMVVGESNALKAIRIWMTTKLRVWGSSHPKHPSRMVVQKPQIDKDKVMQQCQKHQNSKLRVWMKIQKTNITRMVISALTMLEEINDVDGDKEYYQKSPIKIADIQSISNQGFCMCGKFSSESKHSNHIVLLTVFFNSQCAPVQVLNFCKKHLSETTNKDGPCQCVVLIHNHFLKMKVPDWSGSESDVYDVYCIYPIAYQQRRTIEWKEIQNSCCWMP